MRRLGADDREDAPTGHCVAPIAARRTARTPRRAKQAAVDSLPSGRPPRRRRRCSASFRNARSRRRRTRPRKAVIFLHQWGGPGQHETFDMKPDAPDEVRG